MARISGNVLPDGTKSSNTSSKSGFTVELNESMYTITFNKAFSETPTVLVNLLNQELGPDINTNITTAINPGKEKCIIQFWNNDTINYPEFNFCFAAFGDLA